MTFDGRKNCSSDPTLDALEDWRFWLQLMKDRFVVGIPKRTSAYKALALAVNMTSAALPSTIFTWIG